LIALEHKSKSDAMVLLNQELGLEASLKMSEQLVKDTQKTTELLKIHQFDSVDSVQAISKIWDVELEKAKQFAVDLKVAENSVADSEKLLMNQTLISKCLKIKKILLKSVN
jgi:exonuclease SbcC